MVHSVCVVIHQGLNVAGLDQQGLIDPLLNHTGDAPQRSLVLAQHELRAGQQHLHG